MGFICFCDASNGFRRPHLLQKLSNSHPPTVPMVDEHARRTVIPCRPHRFPYRTIAPIQDGIGNVEQNSFVFDFLHMLFLFPVKRTGSTGLPFRVTVSDGARRMGHSVRYSHNSKHHLPDSSFRHRTAVPFFRSRAYPGYGAGVKVNSSHKSEASSKVRERMGFMGARGIGQNCWIKTPLWNSMTCVCSRSQSSASDSSENSRP